MKINRLINGRQKRCKMFLSVIMVLSFLTNLVVVGGASAATCYYDKYYAQQYWINNMTTGDAPFSWVPPPWNRDEWYESYTFDPYTNTYGVSGRTLQEKLYTGDYYKPLGTATCGICGKPTNLLGVIQVLTDMGVNGSHVIRSCCNTLTYRQGAFIERITAPDGAHPENGFDPNDGFWYVKVGVANQSPSVEVISPTANQAFASATGYAIEISGSVNDPDIGDKNYIKYAIDNDNNSSAILVSLTEGKSGSDEMGDYISATGSPVAYKTSAMDVSALKGPNHTLYVWVTDNSSNVSAPTAIPIQFINDAPSISISSPITNQLFSDMDGYSMVISGNITDLDAGDKNYVRYSIDNNSIDNSMKLGLYDCKDGTDGDGDYLLASAGLVSFVSQAIDVSNLTTGTHTLFIWGLDNHANKSSVTAISFRVDKTLVVVEYSKYQSNIQYIENPNWGWCGAPIYMTSSFTASYSFNPQTNRWSPAGVQFDPNFPDWWKFYYCVSPDGTNIVQGMALPPGPGPYKWEGTAFYDGVKLNSNNTMQYVRGTFIEVVRVPLGTYPDNGRHTDGFWYVKSNVQNNTPIVSISSPVNNQEYSKAKGFNLDITGTVYDPDAGDKIYVKYTIDNSVFEEGNYLSLNGKAGTDEFGDFLNSAGSPMSFSAPTIDVSEMAAGNHTLRIWTLDGFGNLSNPATVTFNVVPPPPIPATIELSYPADSGYYSENPSFNTLTIGGSVYDPDGRGRNYVKYSFDSDQITAAVCLPLATGKTGSDTFGDYISGDSAPHPFSSAPINVGILSEGQHVLYVWVTDDRGVSGALSKTIYIDKTAPVVDPPTVTPNSPFQITIQPHAQDAVSSGVASGLLETTYVYNVNSIEGTSDIICGLKPSTQYSCKYKVSDKVGNTSYYSDAVSCTTLSFTPEIKITTLQQDPIQIYQAANGYKMVIAGSVYDLDPVDKNYIKYAIDNSDSNTAQPLILALGKSGSDTKGDYVDADGTWLPFSSEALDSFNLGNGDHKLYVWTLDSFGNYSSPVIVPFTVKIIPPQISLIGPETNSFYSDHPGYNQLTAVGSITDSDGNRRIYIKYSVDDNDSASGTYLLWKTGKTGNDSTGDYIIGNGDFLGEPIDVGGLSEGAHVLYVWAIDERGVVSQPQTITIYIDKTAPTVAAPTVIANDQHKITMMPNAQDSLSNGVSSGILAKSYVYNMDDTDSTQNVFENLTANSPHTFKYKVSDNVGNASEYSVVVSRYTLAEPPVSGITLIKKTSNSIEFSFTENTDQDRQPTYRIEARLKGAGLSGAPQGNDSDYSASTTRLITGLAMGNEYEFWCWTKNNEEVETTPAILLGDAGLPNSYLRFEQTIYQIAEGSPSFTIDVFRDGDRSVEVQAQVYTSGSAIEESNYSLTPKTITFLTGETKKQITFTILDDTLYRGTLTANLTLHGLNGSLIGTPAMTTVSITDNDVTSTDPPNGGTINPNQPKLRISFPIAIKSANLNAITLTINGTPVELLKSKIIDQDLIINPKKLEPGTTYTLTVPKDCIIDILGNPVLAVDLVITFTTAP